MLLNITNGDYLNAKLSKKYEGDFFPFREAIIQGEVTSTVLDDEFIKVRAKSLGVSEEYYKQNAEKFIDFTKNHNKYSNLKLWFGKDTFCQLNLLTLLALLEQINYIGEISLVLIDDETGSIIGKEKRVELGVYREIYNKILIEKQPNSKLGDIDKRAIELYFDYLSLDGYLANLIRENLSLSEDELMVLLLNSSKEYGLSDLNIRELITRVKI